MKEEVIEKSENLSENQPNPDCESLRELFKSNGWFGIGSQGDEVINQILERSSHKVVVKDPNTKKIIGFIRSMDDDIWQATIDVIVVHKDYQNKGLGASLMKNLLEDIGHIPYINVFTNSEHTAEWLKQFGFQSRGNGTFLELRR